MKDWDDAIRKATAERAQYEADLLAGNSPAQIQARQLAEADRQQAWRLYWEHMRQLTASQELLSHVQAEYLLRKFQTDVWRGKGSFLAISSTNAAGFRLVLPFNAVIDKIEAYGQGDSGTYTVGVKAHGASVTEVLADSMGISVVDNEFRRERSPFDMNNFYAFGGSYSPGSRSILLEKATPQSLASVLLDLGVHRIREGRIPGQIQR